MAAIVSQKYTLDIAFHATDGTYSEEYTWKFNDPQDSVSSVTDIRLAFGFDSNGDPSTGTGLFGSLYQDGLRIMSPKTGLPLQAITGAQKIQIITTKEDLPI